MKLISTIFRPSKAIVYENWRQQIDYKILAEFSSPIPTFTY